jgi:hypothetical protein
MSDDKPNPVDDLKQGLGLLFRAAKGAVEKIPTDKVEDVAKDAAKEVARAFESLGQEVEKVIHPNKKSSQPPSPSDATASSVPDASAPSEAVPPAEQKRIDDAYAPDPPKR